MRSSPMSLKSHQSDQVLGITIYIFFFWYVKLTSRNDYQKRRLNRRAMILAQAGLLRMISKYAIQLIALSRHFNQFPPASAVFSVFLTNKHRPMNHVVNGNESTSRSVSLSECTFAKNYNFQPLQLVWSLTPGVDICS